ncbi:MAG TPA: helix-turn-helix domain-containing protein [Acidimicrobiales bacterium]|nr:helix-turn-helix domain-containing protein [Acidimicrobiales bacterium]
MLGKTYDGQVCSIARALEAVGERWSLLIVRDALFAGVTRFNDFQHNLGLATNVLATRLDSLVAAGVMERHPSPERPAQHEYVLTEKGRDLAPALISLTAWGDRWSSPNGPPILYRHALCGGSVRHELACSNCGAIDASEVTVRPGPGMPAEYLANRRRRTTGGHDAAPESVPERGSPARRGQASSTG